MQRRFKTKIIKILNNQDLLAIIKINISRTIVMDFNTNQKNQQLLIIIIIDSYLDLNKNNKKNNNNNQASRSFMKVKKNKQINIILIILLQEKYLNMIILYIGNSILTKFKQKKKAKALHKSKEVRSIFNINHPSPRRLILIQENNWRRVTK